MAKRVTLYFPNEAATKLQSIKQLSRLHNNADVIRAALDRYEELLDATLAGYEILVRDKAGKDWVYSPYEHFDYPGLAKTTEGSRKSDKAPKNFVFPARAAAKLELIRRKSSLQSNPDVIRASLAAYDELLRVVRSRDRIVIRDQTGREYSFNPHASLHAQIGTSIAVEKRPHRTRKSVKAFQGISKAIKRHLAAS